LYIANNGNVGIGNSNPQAKLDIGGATSTISNTSGNITITPTGNLVLVTTSTNGVLIGSSANTLAPLSISGGIGNNAALIVNNLNNGDLIAASASGVTKFRLDNSGNASMSGSLTMIGANSIQSTSYANLTIGGNTTGQVVLSGFNGAVNGITFAGYTTAGCTLKTTAAGVVICGTDLTSAAASLWQELTGALSPTQLGDDFLLGGSTTASAKFAFTGLMGNQTQASFSGQFIVMPNNGYGGNASISGNLTLGALAASSLQTTNNRLLTIGGNTTGDIQFKPGNSGSSLYLTSNGNVGIGTTLPLATLDVRGNSATTPIASFSGSTNFAGLVVDNSGNGDLITASSSAHGGSNPARTEFKVTSSGNVYGRAWTDLDNSSYFMDLNAAGTSLVTAGNVGIGNTNPGTALDVRGTLGSSTIASISGNLIVMPNGGWGGNVGIGTTSPGYPLTVSNTSAGAKIDIGGSTGSVGQNGIQFQAIGGGSYADKFYLYNGNSSGDYGFHLYDSTANAWRLTVNNAGNVGIGTTSPSTKLEVGNYLDAATNIITVASQYQYEPELNFKLGETGTGYQWIGAVISSGDNGNYNGKLLFKTANAGRDTPTTKMIIQANGNVGIGTTTPGYTLQVTQSGADWTIHANGAGGYGLLGTGSTYAGYFQGPVYMTSNLSFASANPTISASSYFIAPGGAYFNSGTVYTEAAIQARGGIHNDSGSFLTLSGGTSGITNISGTANTTYGALYVSNAADQSSGLMMKIEGGAGFDSYPTDRTFLKMTTPAQERFRFMATGVGYSDGGWTTPADYAEYFQTNNTDLDKGELVTIDPDNPQMVKRASAGRYGLVGVISTKPGIVGVNADDVTIAADERENNPKWKIVGILGQIPTKVSAINGSIKVGDYITSSSIPGVGMKATTAGQVIGKAMEEYTNTDPNAVGKINVLVSVSWYDPQVMLTSTGDLNLVDQTATDSAFTIPHYFTLNDALGNPISRVGAFSDAVIANLRVGLVSAQQISTNSLSVATENVTIGGQSLRSYITSIVSDAISNSQFLISNGQTVISPLASVDNLKTNLISPLADNSNISVKLDNSKFQILNTKYASGSAVASIDNLGNATFSGQLSAASGQFGDATISGTLHAGKILASDIVGLASNSATYVTNVTNVYNSTPAAAGIFNSQFPISNASNSGSSNFGLIAGQATQQSSNGNNLAMGNYINISSFSGQLAYVDNLGAANAMFSQNLMVFGQTTLSDTSIVGQLSIGGNMILANGSINVLGSDLNLQPLRQGGLSVMGGLFTIDTNGNVKVGGDAEFAKNVAVKGTLSANIISPLPGSDLTVGLSDKSKLVVNNSSNSAILAINQVGDLVASGAATFSKLNLGLIQPAFALSPTELVATGSAGTANVSAYQTQVTINNPSVTDKSLIYITPTSSTNNQVLYLLKQVPGTSFTVGLQNPGAISIPFNWIIVN
jgi:hypothetical protein